MENMSKLQVRQLITNFIKRNRDKPKSFIRDHFLLMGVAKSTIYDTIKRVEQRKDVTHAGQGKPAVKMTEERKRKVIKAVKNRVGTSQRFLAKKFGCSKTLIQNVLHEAEITYRKRQKAPKVTIRQEKIQKPRIRRLSREE